MLAPPLIFISFLQLQRPHPDVFPLIVAFWATWHGLMQLYGFVRIYDAKVGSTAPATAYWDWLVCLCGFVTAELFSPSRLSAALHHWYSFGGPLIPAGAVYACRWILLAISIGVLIGFTINYVVQSIRGPKPNPIKLLLLASGIGTWWFAVVYVQNVILGVALFDICHDVQYLAIVWMYSCGRVRSNPQAGRFMSYLFRRGMVLLYLGLIAAYGAMGLVPALVQDGTVIALFNGILGTSTLLHYYYDGFIWKVRERATQASLGLDQAGTVRLRPMIGKGVPHLLKWSPLILAVGWLFAIDLIEPSTTQVRKAELEKRFTHSLVGRAALPEDDKEKIWLYTQFEQAQNIAACVPDDRVAQLRAAILMANFGRNDEAVAMLEKLRSQHPELSDAHMALGTIHFYRGNLDQSVACLTSAIANATTAQQRSLANLKLAEVYLHQNNPTAAKAILDAVPPDDPDLNTSIEALRQRVESSTALP